MKRIRQLIELAYDTGYMASSQIRDTDPATSAERAAEVRARIAERNAARDALEADVQDALDALRAALRALEQIEQVAYGAGGLTIDPPVIIGYCNMVRAALAKFE